MSRADDRVPLRHMLDHAREAVTMAGGRQRADLDNDRLFSLAVTRLLEIIGEAATRVSQTTREKHSEVAWPQVVALRNRLIHGYDRVDFDIMWQIIVGDLPPLVDGLEEILRLNPAKEP